MNRQMQALQPLLACLFCALLCLLALLPRAGAAADVEGVRSYRSADHTRLVFDLNTSVKHHIFTLENPHRIVIDMDSTHLLGKVDNLDLSDTPIQGIRTGTRGDNTLRVVLDLKEAVRSNSFSLPRNDQHGDRLVVDLYDNEASSTASSSAPPPQRSTEPKVIASTQDVANGRRDIVVAISAGHGGKDPGAIGVNQLQEKQVVMEIAREMRSILDQTPGYRAVMVREDDYYVNLRQRIQIAHQHSADFFIAIHADAFTSSRARGATIYALSQSGATSEHARRLAEKENAADLIGGVGSVSLKDKDEMLASVLLDLSMSASVASSLEAGQYIIQSLGSVIHMRRTNVEQAAFVVLKSPDIPSLLVEAGYITNPTDARNLASASYRRSFANALVDGITRYFWDSPPRGTQIAWQKANGGAPQEYRVVSGDSLSIIAARFNTSVNALKQANQLAGNSIRAGQTLKIPTYGTIASNSGSSFVEHTIRRGETLSGIASSYHVSLDQIRASNQLNNDIIRPGQVIRIPSS